MLNPPETLLTGTQSDIDNNSVVLRVDAGAINFVLAGDIMSEAEYLCDRIYLLHEGRIVDQGSLQEILARSGCANLTDAFFRYLRPGEAICA